VTSSHFAVLSEIPVLYYQMNLSKWEVSVMQLKGFNIRPTLSLEDIDLALEYLNNRKLYDTELQESKENNMVHIVNKNIEKRY
jgi:hypothetical protein